MHSLAELRRLAAEETRKQAEVAQRARLAAERQRAQIEQERADHERALRAAAESGLHAEIERLELARRAEAEHALAEATARRRLELALTEARSARQTLDLEHAAALVKARFGATLFAILSGVVVIAAGALYLGSVRPEVFAMRAALSAARLEIANARAEVARNDDHARARETALGSRVHELEAELRDARAIRASAAPTSVLPRAPHGGKPIAPPPPPTRICHDDGDPLNGCLKR